MRTTITTLLLLISCFSSFGQLTVDYKFYDSCQEDLMEIDYQLMNVMTGETYPSKNSQPIVLSDTGIYLVSFGIQRGDYVALYGETVELWKERTYNDTISIPRLILASDGTLHPKFTGFTFCSSIADGRKVDTYSNGSKRIEGEFKNAWPVGSLNYYDKTGNLIKKVYYKNKGLTKAEYFDSKGRKTEEEVYRNSKIITSYFDLVGKLTKKNYFENGQLKTIHYNSKGKIIKKE